MSTEPVETLVERVQGALELATHANHRDWSTIEIEQAAAAALPALTELAERLRIAEANHPDTMAGIAALRGRLKAAEKWEVACHRLSAQIEELEDSESRLQERLEAAEERLTAYETPGWINSVQKVMEERRRAEAAEARVAELEASKAYLVERLEAAERWAKAERSGRKEERTRADEAERERDESLEAGQLMYDKFRAEQARAEAAELKVKQADEAYEAIRVHNAARMNLIDELQARVAELEQQLLNAREAPGGPQDKRVSALIEERAKDAEAFSLHKEKYARRIAALEEALRQIADGTRPFMGGTQNLSREELVLKARAALRVEGDAASEPNITVEFIEPPWGEKDGIYTWPQKPEQGRVEGDA